MGKFASKPTHSIFPIGHFRDIIDHAMVYFADCLAAINYIFHLYGLHLKYFDKHRDYSAKYFTVIRSGAIYLDRYGIFRSSKSISL